MSSFSDYVGNFSGFVMLVSKTACEQSVQSTCQAVIRPLHKSG